MRRRTAIAWLIASCVLAGGAVTARMVLGDDGPAGSADERAALASPIVRSLIEATGVDHTTVARAQGCFVSVIIVLTHPVDIDAHGLTATDADEHCTIRRRTTWSRRARQVPSINVQMDGSTHRILYIRPNWDAAGGMLIDQHWDGAGLGWEPGGD